MTERNRRPAVLARLMATLALLLGALAAPAAAAPGTLLSATAIPGAPAGGQAYRIRYTSADEFGTPKQITGTVIVAPGAAPAGGRPVVAWTHGTYGVAEKCAPWPTLFDSIAGLSDMMARGYLVVASDYQGLGNPGPHPYLAGVSTAHSVLDAIRAAKGVSGANPSARFVTWGESQGAHASLWTAHVAPGYAPELTQLGAAAAAPPTDLKANLTGGSNAAIRAFLTAYTAESWSAFYNAPLAVFAAPPVQGLIHRLAQNNCTDIGKPRLGTEIGLVEMIAAMKNVDLSADAPWGELMERNSVSPRDFSVPLMIVQEDTDPVVASTVTHSFAEQACAAGATLHYLRLPDGNHNDAALKSAAQAVPWMADRFAGIPAPSDCGHLP
jgi:alpha-beta hydrolase superfamily lysophospholipase